MFISSYQQLLGINRFQQPSSISVIFTSIDVPQTTGWCCRRPGAYSDQKRDSVLSCLTISLGNPQPDKLPVTLSDMMGKVLTDQPIAPGEGILHHPEGVDLKLLQEAGYEIKPSKNPSFRCEGWGRSVRLDTLGENYSKDVLLSVIKGEKRHTPRKKKQIDQESKRVNLQVDIQAKLQECKGAGYARWARSFNLKQLAQTMNYLTDHGLLEYAALADKVAAAAARHNELSAQIKAAEKRMAEIAVLRTHIINYSKTREVYVAYRKAGYSKNFLAEHEADILLHKAAKKAFDELGRKKIPTVKSLQAEYAQLLEEKKKAYGEFRQARDEMRELLTVKANVDRLLGTEEQEAEQEKEHDLR